MSYSLDFAHVLSAPAATAVFRQTVSDFKVTENLGFEPSGAGEHVFLHIRKRGENTQWLAVQIARFAGVDKRDVGFSGMKDRWAETTQWFSVYLPKGPEPDWQGFAAETEADMDLLAVARHHQKLRRGEHASNLFTIRLTELKAADDLEQRLAVIAEQGVPNYFGEQRFGWQGNNLNLAAEWLEQGKRIKSRNLRGMVMSAARSWLFNLVLARRVEAGNWRQHVEGDTADSAGFPTGPLWGRGRSTVQGEAAGLEESVLAPWQTWTNGLEHCGLNQERRGLVLQPEGFSWQLDADLLELNFSLPPGQFATAVLREIAQVREPVRDWEDKPAGQ